MNDSTKKQKQNPEAGKNRAPEMRETRRTERSAGPSVQGGGAKKATDARVGEKKPHRRGSVILFRVLVAGAACLALFLIVRLLLLLVPIKTIVLSGESFYTLEELCDTAELSEGKRMFGISKKGVSEALLAEYPMLSDVKVKRGLDGTLTLTLTECEYDFYVNVSGTYCLLSREDFRVLHESDDAERFISYGLYEISLPDVRVAFLGDVLEFGEEKSNEYVTVLLDTLDASALADRITGIRAAERFRLSVIIDGKYDVALGSVSDLSRKLDYFSVMEGSDATNVFRSGSDAEIDLSSLNAPTVRAVDRIDTTISK